MLTYQVATCLQAYDAFPDPQHLPRLHLCFRSDRYYGGDVRAGSQNINLIEHAPDL